VPPSIRSAPKPPTRRSLPEPPAGCRYPAAPDLVGAGAAVDVVSGHTGERVAGAGERVLPPVVPFMIMVACRRKPGEKSSKRLSSDLFRLKRAIIEPLTQASRTTNDHQGYWDSRSDARGKTWARPSPAPTENSKTGPGLDGRAAVCARRGTIVTCKAGATRVSAPHSPARKLCDKSRTTLFRFGYARCPRFASRVTQARRRVTKTRAKSAGRTKITRSLRTRLMSVVVIFG
jgi:hypothetical protein